MARLEMLRDAPRRANAAGLNGFESKKEVRNDVRRI
jgi:hypothetical protein